MCPTNSSKCLLNDQHQCRISVSIKIEVIDILFANDVLNKSFKDFEDLYDYVRKLIQQKGLGDLFYYDIAFRIGCCINIYPDKNVYVHRAPLTVAKHMAKKGKIPKMSPGQFRIKTRYFATIFPGLTAWEIEIVMCVYNIDLLAIII